MVIFGLSRVSTESPETKAVLRRLAQATYGAFSAQQHGSRTVAAPALVARGCLPASHHPMSMAPFPVRVSSEAFEKRMRTTPRHLDTRRGCYIAALIGAA